MMLERHFSPERVNEIFNDSSIRPFLGGDYIGYLDLSTAIKNTNNIFLVGEHGCVFFVMHQPGIYEFHTAVLPPGRGQWMIDGSKEAFTYMFTKTDAYELLTQCPDGNMAAKAGSRAVGCSHVFTTLPIWNMNGKLVPVEVWGLVIQNWVKNAIGIEESGKWFHDKLEEEYLRLGKIVQIHEEDNTHNRYVGATVEMLRSGLISKAVTFYNRWAILARYEQIKVLSLKPLIIDIVQSQICVSDNGFEVIENASNSSNSNRSGRN